MEKVQRIDRKQVYTGNILGFFEDTMLFPNGKTEKWDFIHHRGAAAAVAVTDNKEFLMVKQYRPGMDRITLEIPAGCTNQGEEGIITAARELEEETGYKPEHIEHLTDMYAAAAYDDECVKIYLATELKKTHQNLDEDEYLDVVTVPVEKAVEMIINKEIQDSKTITGILTYYVKYYK